MATSCFLSSVYYSPPTRRFQGVALKNVRCALCPSAARVGCPVCLAVPSHFTKHVCSRQHPHPRAFSSHVIRVSSFRWSVTPTSSLTPSRLRFLCAFGTTKWRLAARRCSRSSRTPSRATWPCSSDRSELFACGVSPFARGAGVSLCLVGSVGCFCCDRRQRRAHRDNSVEADAAFGVSVVRAAPILMPLLGGLVKGLHESRRQQFETAFFFFFLWDVNDVIYCC